MSEKYKVIERGFVTFVTITIIDWVDLFIRRPNTNILDDSLTYCIENKGLRVHAYVYMTCHIYIRLYVLMEMNYKVLRDFKKHTSKRLIASIIEIPESRREWLLAKFAYAAKRIKCGINYKLWKDGFHPVILDNGDKIQQRMKYIHENPVESGFVDEEHQWKHSSFNVYAENDRRKPNVPFTRLF